jgi:2'-5' RNA ligase
MLSDLAGQGISFQVSGVDHFYERVVHAKIKRNPDLEQFAARLRQVLSDAGLEIADSYDYIPHITLMKLMKTMDSSFGSKKLPPWAYRNFSDVDFGTASISAIDFCSMNSKLDSTACDFYSTPLHVDLLSES